ncbi:MAG: sulfurase [Burkholderiales bacterium PBB3]|nr:MAG: sulfurase [Burkholderiales bacterium PBB3]
MQQAVYSLVGVQTGQSRKVLMGGRSVPTAIHKSSVTDAVPVGPLGLLGDEQADLTVHGGLDKAVYAYPTEHYPFWVEARAQAGVAGFDAALAWGAMGENLSLQGLLETNVWLGDTLQFAHCTLRVTQPREPCFKFNAAMGFNQAVKRMAQTGYCGFYLAVDLPGPVQVGESFSVIPGPRRLSVPENFQATMFRHSR